MNVFKRVFFLILLVAFLLGSFQKVKAADQFITIVNPVRISAYTVSPARSISAEYREVKKYNFAATWLLTFDVLANPESLAAIRRMDKNQELGIFLEITPRFAEKAGVVYHNSGFWHFANAVFLSGYTQEERIRLIDTVFAKFKEDFGYYPTSVGSWWTDSYSLSYMKEKYQITANLGCSDQFSTDGYQIWGTYWSTPYYPSEYHSGVPAGSLDNKLDLVQFQWAPRDPLNGYLNSTFSTQDYFTFPQKSIDYFEELVRLFASQNGNKFGQVTVGLEGDFTEEVYQGEYAKQLGVVQKLVKNGEFEALTMRDFSAWYRKNFPEVSPPQKVGKDWAIWYQSPHYRLGYVENNGLIEIIDLRPYFLDLIEPYYLSPNGDKDLRINIPAVFDKIGEANSWTLPAGAVIDFEEEKVIIKAEKLEIPAILKNFPGITVRKTGENLEILFADKWGIPAEGQTIKDYSAEAIHFFRTKKAALSLFLGRGWQYFKKTNYLVPQGEIFALAKLKQMPEGRVLIANAECLQCAYQTEFKHPAFANRRGYVRRFGGHQIVYDPGVLVSKDRVAAKKLFDKLKVKYIYLVKFEGYIEKLPFSPGDLGVEKIFENANAEIWKVK